MPYVTMREKSKAILGHKTHTHTYLPTYFPWTHMGKQFPGRQRGAN